MPNDNRSLAPTATAARGARPKGPRRKRRRASPTLDQRIRRAESFLNRTIDSLLEVALSLRKQRNRLRALKAARQIVAQPGWLPPSKRPRRPTRTRAITTTDEEEP